MSELYFHFHVYSFLYLKSGTPVFGLKDFYCWMTIKEFKNPSALYRDVGKLSSGKQTVEFNWSKKHVSNSTIYILANVYYAFLLI